MDELREPGVVVEVRGGVAVVRVERSAACAGCGAGGACRGAGAAERLIEAANEAGARPGDTVTVAVAGGAIVRAAFLVYALPVLGLVFFAGVAQLMLGALRPALADGAAVIGGICGAVVGGLVARLAVRRRGAKVPVARVVEITNR